MSAGSSSLHSPAHALPDVMAWIDSRVRDAAGRRLGRVNAVVADAQGTPWWLILRHRGRDVVAPVASVQATRHHEVLLDRAAETLAPCPAEIDEQAHEALVDRFGLGTPEIHLARRGPRDVCSQPRRRRLRHRD